jgi:hypothetical protein
MFHTLWQRWQQGRSRPIWPGRLPRRTARPVLEALEARVVPSFAAPISYNIGTQPSPAGSSTSADGVATGDFSGNGILDLAVVHSVDHTLNVLMGNGDGTFRPPVVYPAPNMGNGPVWVTVADLNGDGKLDIAVLGNRSSDLEGFIDVFLGNGDGSFRFSASYDSGPVSRGGIAVGDFLGNGRLDLAVADFGSIDATHTAIDILLNNGDGTFQPRYAVPVYGPVRSVTVADFRNNGRADLAVADGLGTNGILDPTYPAGLTILLGNGDGSFTYAGHYLSPATPGGGTVNPEFVTTADLRGNGITDVIECNYDHNINVFLGNGDGTFQPAVGYDTGQSPGGYEHGDVNGTYPRAVAIADLTGNGIPDLVVGNVGNASTNPVQLGSVAVLLGNGDGTFQTPIQYTPFNYPGWAALGDFTGSGRQDLVVTQVQDGHSVNILLNQPEATTGTIRSIDGTANNQGNPTWGSAGTDLLRVGPASYGDGISTLAGAGRPSPRVISNAVSAGGGNHPSGQGLSDFIYAWGQFIDHDLDLTPTGSVPDNIPVPNGDPWFDPQHTGTQVIPDTRSLFDPATGTGTDNPRQQPNVITSYLDGSVIYGSDPARAIALRTLSGGHLKTSSGNLLPFNTFALPEENDTGQFRSNQLFLTGDVRGNENDILVTIETLFVREHNRLADQFAAAHPDWTDEQLYQAARQVVGAEIESITYNEFLPALLGPNALPAYSGYDPTVNAGITTEFSTAGFRLGHPQLNGDIEFLDNNGQEIRPALNLQNAFFNPQPVEQSGIDPILKYLASDTSQEVSTQAVDAIRNILFGPPGSGGQDLISLDIQRGRDHGLPDYNTTRQAYGLPAVTSFAQITSDTHLQAQLQTLYGNVNNIDLFIGGLAEDHVTGSSVGPTFEAILVNQFERTRAGDRFWFENTFSGSELNNLEHVTLADILELNTHLTNLQDNVFQAQPGGRLSFAAPVNYNLGTQPSAMNQSVSADGVTTGDFTGNGILDLAVVHDADHTLSIYMGNGDGTFQPPVVYPVIGPGTETVWVTAADLNNDGHLDLAVLSVQTGGNFEGIVNIFLNNGDGTFRPAGFYDAGPGGRGGIAVGDFLGNGRLDLAVANLTGPDGSHSGVSILLGNGDGTFQPRRVVPVPPGARSVAVADFRHIGRADLVVADGFGTNGILDPNYPAGMTILLDNGDGSFTMAGQYNSPATPGGGIVNPEFVTTADLRGNGFLDVIVANYDHNINVYLGNGDGTFHQAVSYDTGEYPRALAVADLTGNGIPDLVVCNIGTTSETPPAAGSVAVLLGNGDGTFRNAVQYTPFNYPGWLAVGDFTGNGLPDIAVTRVQDGHSVAVLLNETQPGTPRLGLIPDHSIPASQQVLTVLLSATNPHSLPLTYTVTAQSLAWVLTQQTGSLTYDSSLDNQGGRNEKWLEGPDGQWYFILPSGDLYLWDGGSGANGTDLGRVGSSYYDDPTRLANVPADEPHASLSITGNVLTITRDPAWVSGLVVTVTVSDGQGSDSEDFAVIV